MSDIRCWTIDVNESFGDLLNEKFVVKALNPGIKLQNTASGV